MTVLTRITSSPKYLSLASFTTRRADLATDSISLLFAPICNRFQLVLCTNLGVADLEYWRLHQDICNILKDFSLMVICSRWQVAELLASIHSWHCAFQVVKCILQFKYFCTMHIMQHLHCCKLFTNKVLNTVQRNLQCFYLFQHCFIKSDAAESAMSGY